MKRAVIPISFSESWFPLHERLQTEARNRRMPVSAFVREILKENLPIQSDEENSNPFESYSIALPSLSRLPNIGELMKMPDEVVRLTEQRAMNLVKACQEVSRIKMNQEKQSMREETEKISRITQRLKCSVDDLEMMKAKARCRNDKEQIREGFRNKKNTTEVIGECPRCRVMWSLGRDDIDMT